MKEKYFNLSKAVRLVFIIVSWVLSVACFAGCSIVKAYNDEIMWLIILLTCVGMGVCVLAICLTIEELTLKTDQEANK